MATITGNSRLMRLIADGKIDSAKTMWVDCYNQAAGEASGGVFPTVTTRINACGHYLISEKTIPQKQIIPINTDRDGNAKTVLAGYHKFYAASLLRYGASGTFIAEKQTKAMTREQNTLYRIRKLTPTEVFRLMDVSDADIGKIQSATITKTLKSGKEKVIPIPKSAQYQLAGNSICVNVLCNIFRTLFIPGQPEHNDRPIQPSLFD